MKGLSEGIQKLGNAIENFRNFSIASMWGDTTSAMDQLERAQSNLSGGAADVSMGGVALAATGSGAGAAAKLGINFLKESAKSIAAQGAVDGLGFTRSQLQHAFKHAKDFGVTGNPNNRTLSEFSSALQSHVDAASTRVIQGTYRGNAVTHHVDPSTGLNVIRDSSGNFFSGWKLSPQQLQHVLTTGKLGGGR